MDGQLTEAEKGRRSAILSEAEKEMSHAYRSGWIGSTVKVLFEEQKERDGRIYWIGHTPQYVKVAKESVSSENLGNQIVSGTVSGFLEEDILLLK